MNFSNGSHLNQYVAPVVLNELRNTPHAFTKVLGKVPAQAISTDGIRYNMLLNNIGVTINPTEEQVPRTLDGKKGIRPWDNFTTETIKVDREELRALAYDKNALIKQMLKDAVKNAVYKQTLVNLAPNKNAAGTPVIETSGENDGAGRRKLTAKDIIDLRRKSDIEDVTIFLSKTHLLDLQEDELSREYFRAVTMDLATATPINFAGVNFLPITKDLVKYKDADLTKRTTGKDAVTDRTASVVATDMNSIFYLNNLMFTVNDMKSDTRSAIPTTELRVYGEFVGDAIWDDKYKAALVSGKV